MTTPQDSLTDGLVSAARRLARDVAAELEPETGLTVDQWRVLRRLAEGQGMTMGDLAEALATPPATVTRLVDGLIDRGLAYRAAGGQDRRRIEVLRSEEGSEALDRAESVVRRCEEAFIGSLDDAPASPLARVGLHG